MFVRLELRQLGIFSHVLLRRVTHSEKARAI